jgi:hypothetical protein
MDPTSIQNTLFIIINYHEERVTENSMGVCVEQQLRKETWHCIFCRLADSFPFHSVVPWKNVGTRQEETDWFIHGNLQYVTTIQYRSDHDNWKDLRLLLSQPQRYNYGVLHGNGAVGERSLRSQPCATHLEVGSAWIRGRRGDECGRRSVTAVFVWVGLPIFKTYPVGFCLVSGSNVLHST